MYVTVNCEHMPTISERRRQCGQSATEVSVTFKPSVAVSPISLYCGGCECWHWQRFAMKIFVCHSPFYLFELFHAVHETHGTNGHSKSTYIRICALFLKPLAQILCYHIQILSSRRCWTGFSEEANTPSTDWDSRDIPNFAVTWQ